MLNANLRVLGKWELVFLFLRAQIPKDVFYHTLLLLKKPLDRK